MGERPWSETIPYPSLFHLIPLIRPVSHFHPLPLPPLQLNSGYFASFPALGRSTKLAIFIPEDVNRLLFVEALFQYRRYCTVRESVIPVPLKLNHTRKIR